MSLPPLEHADLDFQIAQIEGHANARIFTMAGYRPVCIKDGYDWEPSSNINIAVDVACNQNIIVEFARDAVKAWPAGAPHLAWSEPPELYAKDDYSRRRAFQYAAAMAICRAVIAKHAANQEKVAA